MNTITIPWENQSNIWWNETTASIIEHIGLPGGRYTTEVNTECMKFNFKNNNDAFMCKILVSHAL